MTAFRISLDSLRTRATANLNKLSTLSGEEGLNEKKKPINDCVPLLFREKSLHYV